jgi:hypothetical protein
MYTFVNAKRMNDLISKIEKDIWKSFPNENKIGLLTGLSGVALFKIKYNFFFINVK